jgi:glutamate formiminotransferase
MPLVECVPNLSEGRRLDVIETIVSSLRRVDTIRVLDVSSDAVHNRSVITMVGQLARFADAMRALFDEAVAAIDMRLHQGAHPRVGAVDVVPFIPLEGVRMSECVTLARDIAQMIASRFDMPVFLYEEAAASTGRRNLADIRRGEFEGLTAKLASAEWKPDFGPARPHPTAGAVVIGARMPLIAFNVNLATARVEIARAIAKSVRQSSGGLPFVKALGINLPDRGIVQVSMNLTNYEQTSLRRVFEAVEMEAARHGAAVLESEIVGLVPAAALGNVTPHDLKLAGFDERQILENRL